MRLPPDDDPSGQSGPPGSDSVIRVGLRRIGAAELLEADAELRDCALVHAIPRPMRPAVFTDAVARRFPAGATLFGPGDASGAVYLLLKGEVRLVARNGAETVDFATAGKGQVIGESAALTSEAQRPYGASATTEVDVLEIPRAPLSEAARKVLDVHAYLADLRRAREAASSEMSDFFGRW